MDEDHHDDVQPPAGMEQGRQEEPRQEGEPRAADEPKDAPHPRDGEQVSTAAGDDNDTDVDSDEVDLLQVQDVERTDEELNAFWKHHDAWLRQVTAEEIWVEVSDPKQGKRSLLSPNPPVFFKVRTESNSLKGKVYHRYSDFEWLRDVLRNRYVGLLVPSLPEKRVVKSDEFLRGRMRGLTMFLQQIVEVPYFRCDSTVEGFLRISDHDRWESLKRLVEDVRPGTALDRKNQDNEGKRQWYSALQAYKIPRNHQEVFRTIQEHLQTLTKMLKGITDATQRMMAATDMYAQALKDLSSKLPAPGDGTAFFNPDQNFQQQAASGNFVKGIQDELDAFGQVVARWNTVASCFPNIFDKNMHQAFKAKLSNVLETQRMMGHVKQLDVAKHKQEQIIHKLQADEASLGRSGRPEKVTKANKKLTQAQNTLRQLEAEQTQLLKGLFFTEIDLFVQNTVRDLQTIRSKFCTASLEYFAQLTQALQDHSL
ncbi:Sorting nexin MVP1 [Durusdinium trenchii]|uniref:Sorting nexin MVP1 n=1 Tax=Durusdinium trenchii TaxID=1381693 RepID=A0ABP0RTP4_9DINO